ncbi:hypothetical protein EDC01DRAFT_632340 [Geopyxis carbonaria]|nr:hypothetical protein EDC01DRAFT_632340 [Geopyxis carbonaria]
MNNNLLHPVPLHQQQHALSRKRSYEGYTETQSVTPVEVRSRQRSDKSHLETLSIGSNQGTSIQTPFNTYQATPPLDCGGVETPPNSMNNFGGSFFPNQATESTTTLHPDDIVKARMDGRNLGPLNAAVPPSPVSDDGGLGGSLGRLYVCLDDGMDMDMSVAPPPQLNFAPNNSAYVPKLRMGYKSDCEKCQARLPGHYSHFY